MSSSSLSLLATNLFDFSPLSSIPRHAYPPLCPSFRLSFAKSVSQQQVQASAPQPSPGPPLAPAASQPAPPGTPQQVPQLVAIKTEFLYIQTTPSL